MKRLLFLVAIVILFIYLFFYAKSNQLFWGYAIDGFPVTKENVDKLKHEVKTDAQIILFYLQWPAKFDKIDNLRNSLEAIWNAKALPCITWEPMYNEAQKEITISYQTILDGKYDPYIDAFAKEIKSWGKPVIIRFAHEMNLARYHWGTDSEGYGPKSPQIYIELFRYVVDRFRSQGAHNVLWAFCPNSDSIPKESWNAVNKYYPGSSYVDILGMDGYNWDTKEVPWRSFEQIFQTIYIELKNLAPDKPIIAFETATPTDSKKEEWTRNALITGLKWNLKGIIWFHVNKEKDWRMSKIDLDLMQKSNITAQDWAISLIAERDPTH